ncbi:dipeptidase [Xinfangfangia sp. CPCC 101601]|uniref:Dipeptidase n=1 Tax=Pseudogemmobacter lacusdianii TaxID=3069608 RepID=A0ABU0W0T7_9RHOB|nr:dipeptidase [Xinfangfangia sp. CPCC 101601]MDQ2067631.1 dipeptidase [Xinfangfangia sp. CPCC 101601]
MTAEAWLDQEQKRYVDELIAFIRIPSVSAKPENMGDVQKAAEWVAERVKRAGIDNARVLPTAGHPVVYADWMHAGADKPTVMIYGHFDVQPAEPYELWDSAPFEPEIRGDRIYGRGASDDKAGMMTPILAVEALLKTTGKLPVNVKLFFEGQEEIGSPDLPDFVRDNVDLLKADMIFSADGLQWTPEQPMLVDALKGMAKMEIVVQGPRSDQHSGLHGAAIANPAMALAQILASMKSLDGLITVEGFYDDVIPLSEEDRAEIARVPYDEAEYLAESGAPATFGEPGYTTRERLWARPALDVNGLTSGYQGIGSKTVHPAEARAKITCRLVAAQDPVKIYNQLEAHVRKHTPHGVTVRFENAGGGSVPYHVPAGHNATAVAREVLAEVFGVEPYRTRSGGSIPVMSTLLDYLGVHAVMFGWSMGDENLHAPNEFARIGVYRKGQSAYVRLLEKLGG